MTVLPFAFQHPNRLTWPSLSRPPHSAPVVCLFRRRRPWRPSPERLDAVLVAGMVGEPLWRARPAAGPLSHPLPELHRLLGVVTGQGHQEDADVIGLRLLFPVVAQT